MSDNGITLVFLSQCKVAIIDSADAERVLAHRWCYAGPGYAGRDVGGRRHKERVFLHRWLMDTPKGLETDHINGNKLDCRRKNLRIATRQQNSWNKPRKGNNASGYKGVYARGHRWEAAIQEAGRQRSLGRFDNIMDAARAYDTAARELHGEFARLNFPD